MAALGIGYLLACDLSRRRAVHGRELHLRLPRTPVALLQALLSSLNWLLIGTLLWVLFEERIPWPTVFAVLLLASIAGVLTHVPAGLGVMEAVFLAALGDQVPPPRLLAGLLAYRAAYHLLPLLWAVPAWALGESHAAVTPGRPHRARPAARWRRSPPA